MADERWQRVRQLFDACVELPPDERRRFLGDACDGDPSLRDLVESLVVSSERSGGFLEAGYSGSVLDDLEGCRLGAYELGPLIGAGGMGEVYRARDTRLNRTVAIKLHAGGFGARADLREQFAREARAISALNHPHICQLYDVGRHETLDFLVMEYVEGEPIDSYCSRTGLRTRERLQMFRTVCETVHYAHQNLVVHRDLKPANILVTADGQPKLLDFGIAKLLDATAPGDATPTLTPRLTPEYASPEQVRGEVVTTAADVYSLGIVLYGLLTGRRPYTVRVGSLEDIVRSVCETDPIPPSAVAGRDSPDGSAPATAKELAGDLDTIVLKALRKEPEHRYRSAQELADDIGLYLNGRPVAARGDALSYRAGRFLARHRAAVLVGVLFLAGLLVAMVLIVRQSAIAEVQRQRAERRFADVRKLAGSFLFEFHDAIKALPGSTRARQLVMSRALQYLDSLVEESAGDAALRAELARAYKQVGDILGGFREANLGDLAGALQSYRKALAVQEDLGRSNPADRSLQRDLARTLLGIGDVLMMQADLNGALESLRRSLSINEQLAAAAPDDRDLQRDVAIGHYRVGNAFEELDMPAEADRSLRRAIGMLQELSAARADLESRHALARGHKRLGMVRALVGDLQGSLSMSQEAVRVIEALALDHPMNTTIRNEVAMCHLEAGRAQSRLQQFDAALRSFQRAEAITRGMAAADPSNAQARWMQALELNLIGDVLKALNRPAEAIAAHTSALALLSDIARADPSNENYQYNLANTYQLIGDASLAIARAAGRSRPAWLEARSWYRRSASAFDALRQRGSLTGPFAADADKVRDALALTERELARGGEREPRRGGAGPR